MAVKVFVVKSRNPTSGKGSYALRGVFWTREEAQAFIDEPDAHPAGGPPRAYSVHKFVEVEEQAQP